MIFLANKHLIHTLNKLNSQFTFLLIFGYLTTNKSSKFAIKYFLFPFSGEAGKVVQRLGVPQRARLLYLQHKKNG
jgi:hypothetical protein